MCTIYVPGAHGTQKRAPSPAAGVIDDCDPPCGRGELNPDLL